MVTGRYKMGLVMLDWNVSYQYESRFQEIYTHISQFYLLN